MNLHEEFYKNYQTNYFKVQQIINKEVLDNIDSWVEKFKDEDFKNSKEEIIQIIKSHIRITYLHCVDTLFELVFGLYPRNEKIQDYNLPIIVSKNNDNFNKLRINGLANQEKEIINELKKTIYFRDKSCSLIQYIFYYQLNADIIINNETIQNIEKSVETILELLKIFAQDLKDKSEYNSLKHALRAFPFSGYFKIKDPITNQQLLNIDFKNAHKFIKSTKDDIIVVSKNFNTERDFEYTMIASRMIWNIIKVRETFIVDNPCVKPCFLYFFENTNYNIFESSITHKQNIEIKFPKNKNYE